MKITISKAQWAKVGKDAGWMREAQDEQQRHLNYLLMGIKKASEYLNYHAQSMTKILSDLIQKNPNLKGNDIADALMTLDRMEPDMASAIVKLIEKSMNE